MCLFQCIRLYFISWKASTCFLKVKYRHSSVWFSSKCLDLAFIKIYLKCICVPSPFVDENCNFKFLLNPSRSVEVLMYALCDCTHVATFGKHLAFPKPEA